MPDIRIRERSSGRTALIDSADKVPAGFDLIGPADAPPPAAPPIEALPPKPFRAGMSLMDAMSVRPGDTGGGLTPDQAAERRGEFASTAAGMPLPMAGAAAGTALMGPGPGTAIGGMVGEGLNQALGITDVDPSAVAMQGALPMAAKPVAQATNATARFLAKKLPGAAAILHEMALGKVHNLVPSFPSSSAAYGFVASMNPALPMPNLRRAGTDLLTAEQRVASGLHLPTDLQAAAGDLAQRAAASPANPAGTMAFQDIRANLRRVGAKIRETRPQEIAGTTSGNAEEHGAWKKIYAAMMQDMDDAVAAGHPAQPAVQALKDANLMARREFAADELADILSLKRGGLTVRQDLGFMANGDPQMQLNMNRIMGNVMKSEDIRKALTPKEYDALIQDLGVMAKALPALPTMAGVNAGSMRRLTSMAVGSGLGGLVGFMSPGAGVGVGSAVGAALGAKAPDIISRMVMSPAGRQILFDVLTTTNGVITPRTLSLFAATVASTPQARDGMTALGGLAKEALGVNQ